MVFPLPTTPFRIVCHEMAHENGVWPGRRILSTS